jgi:hypothetical protein
MTERLVFGKVEGMDDILDRHAERIGHVAIAWSKMQERLGQLFAFLLVPPNTLSRAWVVWHSIPSDAMQRRCLSDLVKHVYKDKRNPVRTEVLWVLAEVEKIIDDRNNAVHVTFNLAYDGATPNMRMSPNRSTDNPRAMRMSERNWAADFDFATAQINRLSLYTSELADHLRPHRPASLPQKRPPALTRGQFTTGQE